MLAGRLGAPQKKTKKEKEKKANQQTKKGWKRQNRTEQTRLEPFNNSNQNSKTPTTNNNEIMMLARSVRGLSLGRRSTREVARLAGLANSAGYPQRCARSAIAPTLRAHGSFQNLAASFSSSTVDPERPNLPTFAADTKVVYRPPNYKLEVGQHADASSEYPVMAYQYATTTRDDLCTPAAIIKPANGNVADVVKTIQVCV